MALPTQKGVKRLPRRRGQFTKIINKMKGRLGMKEKMPKGPHMMPIGSSMSQSPRGEMMSSSTSKGPMGLPPKRKRVVKGTSRYSKQSRDMEERMFELKSNRAGRSGSRFTDARANQRSENKHASKRA